MDKPAATQRIPMHAVGDCKTWQMPEVGGERVVYRAHDANAEQQTLASRLTPFAANNNTGPAQPTTRTRLTGSELERLIANAEAEGRERGYQEGLQQGTLAGQAEGLQQGLQAATEQMAALHTSLEKIDTAVSAAICLHNSELQNAIVELVGKIASAVVHCELSVNSTALQEIIHTALSAVNVPDKAVTVFVSEQDYPLLNDHAAIDTSDWQLKVDATLGRGDCRIATQHASIDYTVAQRLDQAVAALYASLATAATGH